VKVLFDEGTPVPLRHALCGHLVETARENGWSGLKNGELIAAAETAGLEVLVTTDQNSKYQQKSVRASARGRGAADDKLAADPAIDPAVVDAVDRATPGSYSEVVIG
jgi:hypothetical protein